MIMNSHLNQKRQKKNCWHIKTTHRHHHHWQEWIFFINLMFITFDNFFSLFFTHSRPPHWNYANRKNGKSNNHVNTVADQREKAQSVPNIVLNNSAKKKKKWIIIINEIDWIGIEYCLQAKAQYLTFIFLKSTHTTHWLKKKMVFFHSRYLLERLKMLYHVVCYRLWIWCNDIILWIWTSSSSSASSFMKICQCIQFS